MLPCPLKKFLLVNFSNTVGIFNLSQTLKLWPANMFLILARYMCSQCMHVNYSVFSFPHVHLVLSSMHSSVFLIWWIKLLASVHNIAFSWNDSILLFCQDVIDLDNQRDKERCVNRSTPMSSESAGYLQQPKIASYVGNNTTTGSGLMQRSETVNHLNCQQLSKVDHTLLKPHSGAPNAPATISDAEVWVGLAYCCHFLQAYLFMCCWFLVHLLQYALLLHQKLNRSSRVPRVPRMRHAGSLPQLASPTGANMLMKQSPSSSAGKDHGPVSCTCYLWISDILISSTACPFILVLKQYQISIWFLVRCLFHGWCEFVCIESKLSWQCSDSFSFLINWGREVLNLRPL